LSGEQDPFLDEDVDQDGAPGREDGPLELRLDLPAAHSAARMARHLIRPFARSGGVTGGELDNLLLVASELMGNAVDHGGGDSAMEESDLEAPVRMKLFLTVEAGGWQLEVSDEGGGEPETLDQLIHPDGLPDLEDERGRGFFLISQMVDQIVVRKSEDGLGLALRVVKRTVA
jgi:anti-sigma regulatory factor (Ser/Thr protein kinase)